MSLGLSTILEKSKKKKKRKKEKKKNFLFWH